MTTSRPWAPAFSAGAGQLDGVGGVVGADAGHDLGPVADGLDDRADQPLLLRVGRGGRLPGRAVDDQAVVAVLDQERGEPLGALDVELAVRGEGVTIAVSTRPNGVRASVLEVMSVTLPAVVGLLVGARHVPLR